MRVSDDRARILLIETKMFSRQNTASQYPSQLERRQELLIVTIQRADASSGLILEQ